MASLMRQEVYFCFGGKGAVQQNALVCAQKESGMRSGFPFVIGN